MDVNPLRELRRLGQGVWLDNLSRALIQDGELARLVAEDGLSGLMAKLAYKERFHGPPSPTSLRRQRRCGPRG